AAGSGLRGQKRCASGGSWSILSIRLLGITWNQLVREGTDAGTLKKGLGHYAGSARLGERGNFSVAGHRRTHGDPFKDFPQLGRGDAVVLTDGTTWFT